MVAFTAAQIPHIDDRRYPAALAGKQYPNGIPIFPEAELDELLKQERINEVIFAYSDVNFDYIEERRRRVAAHGAEFSLFDVDASMLASRKPVIAVTAVRTGCGKSQVSRRITDILREQGKKTVAIRHPMPYGDLAKQAV
ncbi:MAG: GTPase, partial [Woeseiaceae bacterium]|nr:GTPase [Woeseiaceae bacterium]